MSKSVLTVATGKSLYINLAINLYHSFIFHNRTNNIQFYVVTDQPDLFRPIITEKLNIIQIQPNEFGSAFSPKLHLDKVAPIGQTLFIDSDCLVFRDLDSIFKKFEEKSVSVVGSYIKEGEWFGDIAKICQTFNITKMPKFNGGIYYLDASDIARKTYKRARELEKKYDEIGFVRLRGKANDEMLMSLAMALENQIPVDDDGTIMGDLYSCPIIKKANIISGETVLINPPKPNPLHRPWYPSKNICPAVIHYLDVYTSKHSYVICSSLLKIALKRSVNKLDHIHLHIRYKYPELLSNVVKSSFRPLFRMLFGTRKIKKSERIIE